MRASIIVPMFNEEKRAVGFLKELIRFKNEHIRDYEVIFVNDGSTDGTLELIKNIARKEKDVKIVSYKKNKGKGAAVREGIFNSKGKKIIFIDADGSICPGEIPKMISLLDKYDVVVGNRVKKGSVVIQPLLRRLIGIIFNIYVNLLYNIKIRDNLCGFKGFKRDIAFRLFRDIIDKRWVFDVELFYKIRKNNLKLYEQPIHWVHKGGTKISIIDPLKMAIRLLFLRLELVNYK